MAFLTEMNWLALLGRSVVGFPEAAKLESFLAAADLRPRDLREVLVFSVEEHTAFVLKVDDAGLALSRLKSTGLHAAVIDRHEIVMLSTGPGGPDDGLWFWTALDKNTLAFGQRKVANQFIELAEHQRPSLYEKLPELRHLLSSAIDAELAVYTFETPASARLSRETARSSRAAPEPSKDALALKSLTEINASVWGCRRSERTALFFMFFETHSRTAARVMANLGNFVSRFQSTHSLDGRVLPDRMACDQEGSLVRAYGFVDRAWADRAFSAAQTFDSYSPF